MLWMLVDEAVVGPAGCSKDDVRLIGPDGAFRSSQEVRHTWRQDRPQGPVLTCAFVFPTDMVTEPKLTLAFDSERLNCPVPDIEIQRRESSGFTLQRLQ